MATFQQYLYVIVAKGESHARASQIFVVLLIILLVSSFGCGAKKGQLSGKIYDNATKELITGSVVVTLTGESSITVTNGQFQFMDVPVGSKTLTVQAEGYETYTATVKIEAGKKTTKDVYLVEEVIIPPDPVPGDKSTYTLDDVVFDMRYAPSGSFTSDDYLISENANLPGEVEVANPFWIAETEVTYELWYKVYTWAMANGYTFLGEGREGNDGVTGAAPTDASQEPVTTVYWRDAVIWCNALTEYYNAENGTSFDCVYKMDGNPARDATNTLIDKITPDSNAKGFRLPTINEWQLAARYQDGTVWTPGDHVSGDTSGPCYSTDPTTVLSTVFGDYAWYNSTSTQPVGQKLANALGVKDMCGNVSELCFDRTSAGYNSRYYRGGCTPAATLYLQIGKVRNIPTDFTYDNLGFRFVRTP